MNKREIKIIQKVPIFKKIKTIDKIDGGITNQNFKVSLINNKSYFVRICNEIPEHLIKRENEINASNAASEIEVSPKLVYSNNKLIVFDFVQGKTLNERDVQENIIELVKLLKKVHTEIPKKLKGVSQIFWVFHVARHYNNFLNNNGSKYKKILKDLLIKAEEIEKQSAPFDIVYGHNDLLAANFIKKNNKFILVDWEYAGYNTPLFDLGGLSSNNNFNTKQEKLMLENYFENKISNTLIHKFNCIKAASLLRETMWSMVAEIVSKIDFDYKNYTEQNLENFYLAYKKLKF